MTTFIEGPVLRIGAVTGVAYDGGEDIAAIPWSSVTEKGLSAFGAASVANGISKSAVAPLRAHIRDVNVTNYRGAGITSIEDGSVFDSDSYHNYIGAKLRSSDAEISRCRLFNNRDTGLWIAASAANCQSLNNHCYGAQIACYNEGGPTYRACNDTYADSFIGYLGGSIGNGSHQVTLTNVHFQHNVLRDCIFQATSGHLVNCIVNVQRTVTNFQSLTIAGVVTIPTGAKVGVELGERCSIRGGVVELANWYLTGIHTPDDAKPAEAIWVLNGSTAPHIDTLLVDAQNINGNVGVRVKGSVWGLKIDADVWGFHQTDSKVLILDTPAACTGLDIKLRIPVGNALEKTSVDEYVTIGTEWKGRIELVNTPTGAVKTYVDGSLVT